MRRVRCVKGMGRTRSRLAMLVVVGALPVLIWAAVGGAATRTESITFNDAQVHSLDVECPRGKRAVLGGMTADFGDSDYLYLESIYRPSKRVLRVRGYFPGSQPATLTGIATCKRKPKSREVSKTITVAADTQDSVTAKCPKGRRIAFGGFSGDLNPTGAYVSPLAAFAESQRRWTVVGTNESSTTPGELSAYAYCGKVKKATERKKTVPLGGNFLDTATATAKCKRKERLAFGGFDINTPGAQEDYVAPTQLEQTSSRKWTVSATNDSDPDAEDITSFAYCIKKKPRR